MARAGQRTIRRMQENSLRGRVPACGIHPAPPARRPARRDRTAGQLVRRVEVLERVLVVAPIRVQLGERQGEVDHRAPLVVLAALLDWGFLEGHGGGPVAGSAGVSPLEQPAQATRSIDVGSALERAHRAQHSLRAGRGPRARNVFRVIRRDDALAALEAEPFDLVVIGGGITGAGVALDAASRGYSVALVERGDYAAGTSSRSSKLVHGGLRYLQNFDLGLVREALLERQ